MCFIIGKLFKFDRNYIAEKLSIHITHLMWSSSVSKQCSLSSLPPPPPILHPHCLFSSLRNRLLLPLFCISPNHGWHPHRLSEEPPPSGKEGAAITTWSMWPEPHETRYAITRDAFNHFLSLHSTIPSPSARFAVSPLRWISAFLLLLPPVFAKRRMANTCNGFSSRFAIFLPFFLHPSLLYVYLVSISISSLFLSLSLFSLPALVLFFTPLSRCSRGCCRDACFASDYYLPRRPRDFGILGVW